MPLSADRRLAGVLLVLPLAVALVMGSAASPAAQDAVDEAAYRESVRQLLEASGGTELGRQIADTLSRSMVEAMQGTSTRVPPRALEIAREVIDVELTDIFGDADRLLDLYVPVYRQHFSKDEIDAIAAFYRTPVGQKAARTLPVIVQESMQRGQALSQERFPRILETIQRRLAEEGVLPR